jgi:ion channel-forming bestrophin family protein
MHAGRIYTIREVVLWTFRDTIAFVIVATIPTAVYYFFGWNWIMIPWLPVALVGTAVAFLIGFKNNASYDRLWEARKIWGAIVNDSRTMAIMSRDFVKGASVEELHTIHRRIIYRHIAWITALRYQLRSPRQWEHTEKIEANVKLLYYSIPEHDGDLLSAVAPYLSGEELSAIHGRTNAAAQIMDLQGQDLGRLHAHGLLNDFQHVELHRVMQKLIDAQGRCERIKNFPYPRQYATVNLYFVWVFIVLVPFGMLTELREHSQELVWLTIPFSTLVAWIFHTMEKIGEVTENPFEGGANDIPMAAIARSIEIDIREMLDDVDVPSPLQPVNNILM